MADRTAFKGIAIAGATASGKSALALRLALHLDGIVINADSAQVYRDLRLLSARPSAEDEATAPHALYGFVDGATAFSAADWARKTAELIYGTSHLPIIVGGTGLYFRALFEGLAELPPIPPDIRDKWRALAYETPAAAFHDMLRQRDPDIAARLMVNDRQRITRALEVFETTGQPLSALQATETKPVVSNMGWLRIILHADRDILSQRITQRFEQMVSSGALDEVRSLLARNLNPAAPVMKAIGVPELSRHLAGDMTLEEASQQAMSATRHYAKRQETWFRNQMPGWQRMDAMEAEKLCVNAGPGG